MNLIHIIHLRIDLPLGLLGELGTLDQFILLSHFCDKCGNDGDSSVGSNNGNGSNGRNNGERCDFPRRWGQRPRADGMATA